MRFESAKDMYETVSDGKDLYNEKLELYVFVYNDVSALCYYPIDPEEADELRKLSKEHDEYWGAFLGIGGYILDNYDYSPYNYEPDEYTNEMYELYLKPSYEFCEEYYMHDGWEFC